MRLKSLELNGFKSFVDRTAVRFESGITAVVGPNGCGKSNIVDAMRWAMGEQSPRRLRGKGMEDVIFGGAEGIAPIGLAEVVLTFDNDSGEGPPAFAAYSEIRVARRLYRSGESEYLLNQTACRLRDVQDFFRDTGIGTKGYTIVEQGRIAEIVSARPEDRRALIEEAAGIGKYKARRQEAESKIRSTEQNLLRVSDVLGEIRRQISSIERQAKKAARYKRLRETLRVLELSLAADQRRELVAKSEAERARMTQLRDRITALETQVAERELGVQQKRIELAECERELGQGSEALLVLRTDIKECESQLSFGRREREALGETATARREELLRLREQLAAQEGEVEATGAELAALAGPLESEREGVARSEAAARQAREALGALERERDAAAAALVEVLTAIARAEDRLAAVEDRRAELDARLRSADEGLDVGQSQAALADREQRDLEEGLRNLLAERDRGMGSLREALEAHERAGREAREAGLRLREVREARETRRARLASLREVLERRDDVSAGTRFLLEKGPEARRSFGLRELVRDVLEVEREVEGAVEAVLADRAEALVVERAEGAVSALAALREGNGGRGIFVALPAPEPEALGFVPLGEPLLQRVRPRPGYEALARRLLAHANLVESLDQVFEVYGGGRMPATFVTRAGDLVAPDGTVRGGGAAGGGRGPIGRVREVRDLETEVAELEAEAERCEARHREAEALLARSADELENLRNRHHTAALAVASHEKDLERTRERVKILGEAHEGRVAERSELLSEQEALAAERERLARQVADSRAERASRQRAQDALGLRIGSAGRDLTRLETLFTERRVEHAGRSERQERLRLAHERARSTAAESRDWIARREEEIAAAEARREEVAGLLARAEEILALRLREEEAARAGHDEKRDAYERLSADASALELAARDLRGAITGEREGLGQAELAIRESELELAHLEEAMRERWGLELASFVPPSADPGPPEEDAGTALAEPPGELEAAVEGTAGAAPGEGEEEEPAPDAAREARRNAALASLPRAEREGHLEETRRALAALGEVNLGALEEHEDLSERFRFLSEQKQDLDGTLASLRDAIGRINRTSRRRFRETFEEVSKRFSENFPRLFRGGKASLGLTETEDVLDAGIEIMAQPPGKRLQNVNLLSGGEKTLTAIALLVAVFQVRPAPFFLLDEVDAALDDANVDRFNDIVRELARESQFVLITHNKRTIEIADVLYGVTMERKGISKLVSVELRDVG